MMLEAQAVAEALGVRFAIDVDKRIAGGAEVGAHKTSMLQDLERGRPMEIDALLGVIVELAELVELPGADLRGRCSRCCAAGGGWPAATDLYRTVTTGCRQVMAGPIVSPAQIPHLAPRRMPVRKPLAAATLLLLLPLLGCGPVQQFATLPRDATTGVGDPTRAAVIGSAYAFATPDVMVGRPEAAARAAAQVEYLATEIPAGPRWVDFNPTVSLELMAARRELRAALGIAPDASPQAVADGLFAASRALGPAIRTPRA